MNALFFRSQGDDGNLGIYANSDRSKAADATRDIEETPVFLVKSVVIIIAYHRRTQPEKVDLSAMCVTAKRQLGMAFRQDAALPRLGIMLQQDHKCLPIYAFQSL